MRQPTRRSFLAATGMSALTAALATSLASCSNPAATDSNGQTTLNFFQYKGEALEDFQKLIDQFHQENPNIRVIQNQVADAETAIRTLLVKDRAPDVITLNGNGSYGQLAKAGVFHDFAADAVTGTLDPNVQNILAALGSKDGEVNGLGYTNNANGIIYNRAIFAERGLQPPETWDELIEICEKLQAAGVTPFAGTLADSWTVMPSWNAIGAYAAQDGFFDKMRAEGENVGPSSPVSFSKDFPDAMAKQAQLYGYAQDGFRGATYDDGSALFANGNVAMLMQGIWALSPVKNINPDIDAAIFPYPVPSDPADRVLVSGVDVVVTMPKNGAKQEAALTFINFLFRRDIIEQFAAAQTVFPSVQGAALSDDPALQSVAPYFEANKITGFIDHQIPPAIPLTGIIQQAVFDGNGEQAMNTLDNEWRKVAARTIPVTEG
ncbi:ABC transporter substrate-binding protein [Haematomicrobium sanguinis]|uniref:ABC transporter substrate-binding protein n=1 Tax=Haematomicrobium sanguinis TaxID=479106 RepID=UPI00047AA58E|nr:extracellular solute-binding protein [Haematomicrobium sanguinis]